MEDSHFLLSKSKFEINKLHHFSFSINSAYALFDSHLIAWIPQSENIYFDSLEILQNEPIEFRLNSLGKKKIVKIFCNHHVTHSITDAGLVFSWGNDRDRTGILGLGITYNQPSPLLNTNFANRKIKDISMSEKHAAAIDLNHQVYTWGTGIYGELGKEGSTYSNVPVPIQMNKFSLARKIQCGPTYTAFIDFNGSVIYCGRIFDSNKNLKLNTPLYNKFQNIPEENASFTEENDNTVSNAESLSSNTKVISIHGIITKIFCGPSLLAFIDNSGALYIYNDEENLYRVKIEERVYSVKFTSNSFYAMTRDRNTVYEFSNKMGHKSVKHYLENTYTVGQDFSRICFIEQPYYCNLLFFMVECSYQDKEEVEKGDKRILQLVKKNNQGEVNNTNTPVRTGLNETYNNDKNFFSDEENQNTSRLRTSMNMTGNKPVEKNNYFRSTEKNANSRLQNTSMSESKIKDYREKNKNESENNPNNITVYPVNRSKKKGEGSRDNSNEKEDRNSSGTRIDRIKNLFGYIFDKKINQISNQWSFYDNQTQVSYQTEKKKIQLERVKRKNFQEWNRENKNRVRENSSNTNNNILDNIKSYSSRSSATKDSKYHQRIPSKDSYNYIQYGNYYNYNDEEDEELNYDVDLILRTSQEFKGDNNGRCPGTNSPSFTPSPIHNPMNKVNKRLDFERDERADGSNGFKLDLKKMDNFESENEDNQRISIKTDRTDYNANDNRAVFDTSALRVCRQEELSDIGNRNNNSDYRVRSVEFKGNKKVSQINLSIISGADGRYSNASNKMNSVLENSMTILPCNMSDYKLNNNMITPNESPLYTRKNTPNPTDSVYRTNICNVSNGRPILPHTVDHVHNKKSNINNNNNNNNENFYSTPKNIPKYKKNETKINETDKEYEASPDQDNEDIPDAFKEMADQWRNKQVFKMSKRSENISLSSNRTNERYDAHENNQENPNNPESNEFYNNPEIVKKNKIVHNLDFSKIRQNKTKNAFIPVGRTSDRLEENEDNNEPLNNLRAPYEDKREVFNADISTISSRIESARVMNTNEAFQVEGKNISNPANIYVKNVETKIYTAKGKSTNNQNLNEREMNEFKLGEVSLNTNDSVHIDFLGNEESSMNKNVDNLSIYTSDKESARNSGRNTNQTLNSNPTRQTNSIQNNIYSKNKTPNIVRVNSEGGENELQIGTDKENDNGTERNFKRTSSIRSFKKTKSSSLQQNEGQGSELNEIKGKSPPLTNFNKKQVLSGNKFSSPGGLAENKPLKLLESNDLSKIKTIISNYDEVNNGGDQNEDNFNYVTEDTIGKERDGFTSGLHNTQGKEVLANLKALGNVGNGGKTETKNENEQLQTKENQNFIIPLNDPNLLTLNPDALNNIPPKEIIYHRKKGANSSTKSKQNSRENFNNGIKPGEVKLISRMPSIPIIVQDVMQKIGAIPDKFDEVLNQGTPDDVLHKEPSVKGEIKIPMQNHVNVQDDKTVNKCVLQENTAKYPEFPMPKHSESKVVIYDNCDSSPEFAEVKVEGKDVEGKIPTNSFKDILITKETEINSDQSNKHSTNEAKEIDPHQQIPNQYNNKQNLKSNSEEEYNSVEEGKNYVDTINHSQISNSQKSDAIQERQSRDFAGHKNISTVNDIAKNEQNRTSKSSTSNKNPTNNCMNISDTLGDSRNQDVAKGTEDQSQINMKTVANDKTSTENSKEDKKNSQKEVVGSTVKSIQKGFKKKTIGNKTNTFEENLQLEKAKEKESAASEETNNNHKENVHPKKEAVLKSKKRPHITPNLREEEDVEEVGEEKTLPDFNNNLNILLSDDKAIIVFNHKLPSYELQKNNPNSLDSIIEDKQANNSTHDKETPMRSNPLFVEGVANSDASYNKEENTLLNLPSCSDKDILNNFKHLEEIATEDQHNMNSPNLKDEVFEQETLNNNKISSTGVEKPKMKRGESSNKVDSYLTPEKNIIRNDDKLEDKYESISRVIDSINNTLLKSDLPMKVDYVNEVSDCKEEYTFRNAVINNIVQDKGGKIIETDKNITDINGENEQLSSSDQISNDSSKKREEDPENNVKTNLYNPNLHPLNNENQINYENNQPSNFSNLSLEIKPFRDDSDILIEKAKGASRAQLTNNFSGDEIGMDVHVTTLSKEQDNNKDNANSPNHNQQNLQNKFKNTNMNPINDDPPTKSNNTENHIHRENPFQGTVSKSENLAVEPCLNVQEINISKDKEMNTKILTNTKNNSQSNPSMMKVEKPKEANNPDFSKNLIIENIIGMITETSELNVENRVIREEQANNPTKDKELRKKESLIDNRKVYNNKEEKMNVDEIKDKILNSFASADNKEDKFENSQTYDMKNENLGGKNLDTKDAAYPQNIQTIQDESDINIKLNKGQNSNIQNTNNNIDLTTQVIEENVDNKSNKGNHKNIISNSRVLSENKVIGDCIKTSHENNNIENCPDEFIRGLELNNKNQKFVNCQEDDQIRMRNESSEQTSKSKEDSNDEKVSSYASGNSNSNPEINKQNTILHTLQTRNNQQIATDKIHKNELGRKSLNFDSKDNVEYDQRNQVENTEKITNQVDDSEKINEISGDYHNEHKRNNKNNDLSEENNILSQNILSDNNIIGKYQKENFLNEINNHTIENDDLLSSQAKNTTVEHAFKIRNKIEHKQDIEINKENIQTPKLNNNDPHQGIPCSREGNIPSEFSKESENEDVKRIIIIKDDVEKLMSINSIETTDNQTGQQNKENYNNSNSKNLDCKTDGKINNEPSEHIKTGAGLLIEEENGNLSDIAVNDNKLVNNSSLNEERVPVTREVIKLREEQRNTNPEYTNQSTSSIVTYQNQIKTTEGDLTFCGPDRQVTHQNQALAELNNIGNPEEFINHFKNDKKVSRVDSVKDSTASDLSHQNYQEQPYLNSKKINEENKASTMDHSNAIISNNRETSIHANSTQTKKESKDEIRNEENAERIISDQNPSADVIHEVKHISEQLKNIGKKENSLTSPSKDRKSTFQTLLENNNSNQSPNKYQSTTTSLNKFKKSKSKSINLKDFSEMIEKNVKTDQLFKTIDPTALKIQTPSNKTSAGFIIKEVIVNPTLKKNMSSKNLTSIINKEKEDGMMTKETPENKTSVEEIELKKLITHKRNLSLETTEFNKSKRHSTTNKENQITEPSENFNRTSSFKSSFKNLSSFVTTPAKQENAVIIGSNNNTHMNKGPLQVISSLNKKQEPKKLINENVSNNSKNPSEKIQLTTPESNILTNPENTEVSSEKEKNKFKIEDKQIYSNVLGVVSSPRNSNKDNENNVFKRLNNNTNMNSLVNEGEDSLPAQRFVIVHGDGNIDLEGEELIYYYIDGDDLTDIAEVDELNESEYNSGRHKHNEQGENHNTPSDAKKSEKVIIKNKKGEIIPSQNIKNFKSLSRQIGNTNQNLNSNTNMANNSTEKLKNKNINQSGNSFESPSNTSNPNANVNTNLNNSKELKKSPTNKTFKQLKKENEKENEELPSEGNSPMSTKQISSDVKTSKYVQQIKSKKNLIPNIIKRVKGGNQSSQSFESGNMSSDSSTSQTNILNNPDSPSTSPKNTYKKQRANEKEIINLKPLTQDANNEISLTKTNSNPSMTKKAHIVNLYSLDNIMEEEEDLQSSQTKNISPTTHVTVDIEKLLGEDFDKQEKKEEKDFQVEADSNLGKNLTNSQSSKAVILNRSDHKERIRTLNERLDSLKKAKTLNLQNTGRNVDDFTSELRSMSSQELDTYDDYKLHQRLMEKEKEIQEILSYNDLQKNNNNKSFSNPVSKKSSSNLVSSIPVIKFADDSNYFTFNNNSINNSEYIKVEENAIETERDQKYYLSQLGELTDFIKIDEKAYQTGKQLSGSSLNLKRRMDPQSNIDNQITDESPLNNQVLPPKTSNFFKNKFFSNSSTSFSQKAKKNLVPGSFSSMTHLGSNSNNLISIAKKELKDDKLSPKKVKSPDTKINKFFAQSLTNKRKDFNKDTKDLSSTIQDSSTPIVRANMSANSSSNPVNLHKAPMKKIIALTKMQMGKSFQPSPQGNTAETPNIPSPNKKKTKISHTKKRHYTIEEEDSARVLQTAPNDRAFRKSFTQKMLNEKGLKQQEFFANSNQNSQKKGNELYYSSDKGMSDSEISSPSKLTLKPNAASSKSPMINKIVVKTLKKNVFSNPNFNKDKSKTIEKMRVKEREMSSKTKKNLIPVFDNNVARTEINDDEEEFDPRFNTILSEGSLMSPGRGFSNTSSGFSPLKKNNILARVTKQPTINEKEKNKRLSLKENRTSSMEKLKNCINNGGIINQNKQESQSYRKKSETVKEDLTKLKGAKGLSGLYRKGSINDGSSPGAFTNTNFRKIGVASKTSNPSMEAYYEPRKHSSRNNPYKNETDLRKDLELSIDQLNEAFKNYLNSKNDKTKISLVDIIRSKLGKIDPKIEEAITGKLLNTDLTPNMHITQSISSSFSVDDDTSIYNEEGIPYDEPDEMRKHIYKNLENFKLMKVQEKLENYLKKINMLGNIAPDETLCLTPVKIQNEIEDKIDAGNEFEPLELLDASQITLNVSHSRRSQTNLPLLTESLSGSQSSSSKILTTYEGQITSTGLLRLDTELRDKRNDSPPSKFKKYN